MLCRLGRKRPFRLFNSRSLHTVQWMKHFSARKATRDELIKTTFVCWPATLQYRCMSDQSDKWNTVYEGPISKPVKQVKMLSLTTAAATLVCSPLLAFYGDQGASAPIKMLAVLLLCTIGPGSTALLHSVSKRYVHKMDFDRDEKMFAVETLSLFARRKRTEFSADDITVYPHDRAFSTFEANGVKYFMHKELVEAQQVLHFIEKWQKGEATDFKKRL